MKHVRLYNDETEQQSDFTRPIVYITKNGSDEPSPPVLSKELTLIKSLEITFTSAGRYGNLYGDGIQYTYKYEHDGDMLQQNFSYTERTKYNGKKLLLVVTVDNESYEYVVTYNYINASTSKNANVVYKLVSNDFYIFYNHYETDSGETDHYVKSFYSNESYQKNTPITFDLYAG